MRRMMMMLLLVLLCHVTGVTAQTRTDKRAAKAATAAAIKECMERDSFEIDVRTAFSMLGRSVSLSPYFSLTVRNDSVYSCLPYYGKAYILPYGGGEGLNFSTAVTDYRKGRGKKGSHEIRFSARTSEDYYTFRVEIFDNGSTSIDVTMQNKQGMSFSGQLAEPKADSGGKDRHH